MADGFRFSIDVDTAALIRLLNEFGDQAEAALLRAAEETGQAILREAQARVARATGKTYEGLAVVPLERVTAGAGVAVVQLSRPDTHRARDAKKIPRYLERGTRYMVAQPYFDVAAQLEQGSHLRRVEEALRSLPGMGD